MPRCALYVWSVFQYLSGSIGVEEKAVVASLASVAESVEGRHGDGLAAEHDGHAFRGVMVAE
eukprot:3819488-Pleurochrysis_carterae.AAC.5